MHRFMLLLGIGTSLIAAAACGAEPTLPLAIVAARNAADLVHRLLLERHDPNERDSHGLTPLMWAARAGAVDGMKALLDGGAGPHGARRDQRMDAVVSCNPQTTDGRGAPAPRARRESEPARADARPAPDGRRGSRSGDCRDAARARCRPTRPKHRRLDGAIGSGLGWRVERHRSAMARRLSSRNRACAAEARPHAAPARHDRRSRGTLVGALSRMRRSTEDGERLRPFASRWSARLSAERTTLA
jgi:Ankyrin repeats (3 copies)